MYQVILYYKFAPVSNPAEFVTLHKAQCHELKGRVIIAQEGINGTLAGTLEAITSYKKWLTSQAGFEDVWFKEQSIERIPFPKLSIRARPELVTLRVPISHETGAYVSAKELHELIQKDEVVLFDARNEIESKIGTFKNAITPNTKTFRDLPQKLKEYSHLKDKKVVMFCTGGIRCEKATALAKDMGFNNVHQLHGGIYAYCQAYPQGFFEGTCFVFDDRMQIGWKDQNTVLEQQDVPVSRLISVCEYCNTPTARVINDERVPERVLRICCQNCDLRQDISRLRKQR
jgi:UPF0176 protein